MPSLRGVCVGIRTIVGNYVRFGPRCACGNRNWLIKSAVVCSRCKRKIREKVTAYILTGPKCACGNRDWFVASSSVICSACGRRQDVKVHGYIVNGPLCACGNRDWFVGGSNRWSREHEYDVGILRRVRWSSDRLERDSGARCSACGRWRVVQVRGFIVNGPKCSCGNRDYLVSKSGIRCSRCGKLSWR